MSEPIERLVDALAAAGCQPRRCGEGWSARCPGPGHAHGDRNPSLSLWARDGAAWLRCHAGAGCDKQAILAPLRLTLADLFPEKVRNGTPTTSTATRYIYVNDQGEPVVTVCRTGSGATKKVWREPTGVRDVPLYRLPEVRRAVAEGTRVYVVEGEKCADAVAATGAVATCSPGGAGKWRKVHTDALIGAGEVVVIADHDQPGLDHAHTVTSALAGAGVAARAYLPARRRRALDGFDIADQLGEGGTLGQLDELVPTAKPVLDGLAAQEGPTPDEPGWAVLDAVAAFLERYVAFPSPAALTAAVLWVTHTHLLSAAESSPRFALLSPEPGSGKTRALEVFELLVPTAMHVLSASPPAIFRSIENDPPALLFDECDAIFGKRKGDDGTEDLRALLNAGHRRGATIPRCVGPTHEVRKFPVYCAVALAGLGDLPDTLMSRAVVVRMRRRAPHESVTPFRRRLAAPEGEELRGRLAAWAPSVVDKVTGAWPDMPAGITDRPADVWEPLLAVADAAGGNWPDRSRGACVELCRSNVSRDASLGVRLLADLRTIFGEEDRLGTEAILERLHAIEEAPWADLRGRPMDARGLARRLNNYEVGSTQLKVEGHKVRGYRREDLWDAWQRYLPPEQAVPAVPAVPSRSDGVSVVPAADEVPVPQPVPGTSAVPVSPPLSRGVPQVPQVPDDKGAEGAGSEVVPRLVDLPLDEVGSCRVCRISTVRTDGEGGICTTCHDQRWAS